MEWGLTAEEIEGAIGTPPGPRSATVRSFLLEKGIEFSAAREALQQLLSDTTGRQ